MFRTEYADRPLPAPSSGFELLFFAILPPPHVQKQIAGQAGALKRRLGLSGRLRPTEILHITLCGVEGGRGARPGAVAGARHAAWSLRAEPFELTLDRHDSWPHLVLRPRDNPALSRLRQSLQGALHEIIPAFRPTPFEPHMTLLYGDRAPAGGLAAPIRWTVEDFALIRSFQGESCYQVLDRHRLGD